MKDKEVKEKREDPPEACLDVEFIHQLSHSVKKWDCQAPALPKPCKPSEPAAVAKAEHSLLQPFKTIDLIFLMKDKEVKKKREDPPEACLDVEFIHQLSHSVYLKKIGTAGTCFAQALQAFGASSCCQGRAQPFVAFQDH